MSAYFLQKTLRYVRMAYSKHRALVVEFPAETSLLYGMVPYVTLIVLWEVKNWLVSSCVPQPVSDQLVPEFLPTGLSLGSDSLAASLLMFAIVWTLDVVLFAGAIWVLSRLMCLRRVSARVAAMCYMFCAGTFGPLALLSDAIFELRLGGYDWPFLPSVHPLVAMLELGYLVAFVRQQAAIHWWQSIILVVPGFALAIVSHLVFLL